MTVGCRSGTDDDYSSIVLYARRYVPDASPSRGRCPNCTGTSATKGIIIGNRVGQQGARRRGRFLSRVTWSWTHDEDSIGECYPPNCQ